jgi:hypothetical protein
MKRLLKEYFGIDDADFKKPKAGVCMCPRKRKELELKKAEIWRNFETRVLLVHPKPPSLKMFCILSIDGKYSWDLGRGRRRRRQRFFLPEKDSELRPTTFCGVRRRCSHCPRRR